MREIQVNGNNDENRWVRERGREREIQWNYVCVCANAVIHGNEMKITAIPFYSRNLQTESHTAKSMGIPHCCNKLTLVMHFSNIFFCPRFFPYHFFHLWNSDQINYELHQDKSHRNKEVEENRIKSFTWIFQLEKNRLDAMTDYVTIFCYCGFVACFCFTLLYFSCSATVFNWNLRNHLIVSAANVCHIDGSTRTPKKKPRSK